MKDTKTKRAIEIQDSIRQILYHDWDPIHVVGLAPEDEYDSYLAPVYNILAGSRSEEELIELLSEIESVNMGLSPVASTEHLRPIAHKLLAVDISLHT